MIPDNITDFIASNKKKLEDYIKLRIRIARLRLIRLLAVSAGKFTLLLTLLFMGFLFTLFAGLALGFYLGKVTGSYELGFSIVALVILAFCFTAWLFRKPLFVNPFMKRFLESYSDQQSD